MSSYWVGEHEFHIHAEPSRAQKDASIEKYGHDGADDAVWPWWASSLTFAGGPYATAEEAEAACRHFVATGEGNNLK